MVIFSCEKKIDRKSQFARPQNVIINLRICHASNYFIKNLQARHLCFHFFGAYSLVVVQRLAD